MNKHVLITGGIGFIGHNLAKLYLDKGFKVTIIDDLTNHQNHPRLTKYRMEYLNDKRITFIQKNCSLTFTISDQLKNNISPRSIIHLASYPNQASVSNDRYGAASSMTANTHAVADLAQQIGCRLVYASSSMAYGNFTRLPQPETEPLKPTNLYGLLKAQGEDIARLTCANTVIIRPSAVYGPGDNFNRVLGRWIREQLNNNPIAINDASAMLDFTHVDDLAKGIKLMEENGVAGEAYNLTYGRACSLTEAALLIQKITGSTGGITILNQPLEGEPSRGALDITKAKALGYSPRIDLYSGIKNYISWMKNYEHLYRD